MLQIVEFILPSHVYNIPVPEEAMQPQTIMFPPPNFTVGTTQSG